MLAKKKVLYDRPKGTNQYESSIRISKKVSDPDPDSLRLGLHRRSKGKSLTWILHQPVEKVTLSRPVVANDTDNCHRPKNTMWRPLMTSQKRFALVLQYDVTNFVTSVICSVLWLSKFLLINEPITEMLINSKVTKSDPKNSFNLRLNPRYTQ